MWGVAADRGRALIRKAATSDDDATATVTASPLPLVWGGYRSESAPLRLRRHQRRLPAGFKSKKHILKRACPAHAAGNRLADGWRSPQLYKIVILFNKNVFFASFLLFLSLFFTTTQMFTPVNT